jgi:selenide,water dikinase
MTIVAWPRDQLGWPMLGQVLDGGASVLAAANCALVGGHSIDDTEPKYGLSVTGLVHPNQVMTNAGGRAGDVLVLTKPLGVGIATTAIKRSQCSPNLEATAITTMLTSNAQASRAAVTVGCRGATDITGFGLMGHLTELVRASDVSAEISLAAVPVLDGVRHLASQGCVPGGTMRNHADTDHVDWGTTAEVDQLVLCDAQTSGGLLLAVPAGRADELIAAITSAGGATAVEIGHLVPRAANATDSDDADAAAHGTQPLIHVR